MKRKILPKETKFNVVHLCTQPCYYNYVHILTYTAVKCKNQYSYKKKFYLSIFRNGISICKQETLNIARCWKLYKGQNWNEVEINLNLDEDDVYKVENLG